MHVIFEGSVICYVSLIKEKGSPGITSSCSGFDFQKGNVKLCRLPLQHCAILMFAPLRPSKRLKQTTTLLREGEESSAAAAQE